VPAKDSYSEEQHNQNGSMFLPKTVKRKDGPSGHGTACKKSRERVLRTGGKHKSQASGCATDGRMTIVYVHEKTRENRQSKYHDKNKVDHERGKHNGVKRRKAIINRTKGTKRDKR